MGDVVANNLLRTVAFLGNHTPRQCGIATFTADLSGAIQTSRPAVDCSGDSWVFGPETAYERHGDVGNVAFPCGATVADDLDTIRLYYGAADTCIALANGSIRELVKWLDDNGKPGCPSMGGAGA